MLLSTVRGRLCGQTSRSGPGHGGPAHTEGRSARRRCTGGRSPSASISSRRTCCACSRALCIPRCSASSAQGWISAKWGASENNRRARFYSLTKSRAQAPGTRAGGLGTFVRCDCARAANRVTPCAFRSRIAAALRGWFRPRRPGRRGRGGIAVSSRTSDSSEYRSRDDARPGDGGPRTWPSAVSRRSVKRHGPAGRAH